MLKIAFLCYGMARVMAWHVCVSVTAWHGMACVSVMLWHRYVRMPRVFVCLQVASIGIKTHDMF